MTAVRRDTGARSALASADLETLVSPLLDQIQADMFDRAKRQRDEAIRRVDQWEDFVPALDAKNMVLIPWCDTTECEEYIKDNSRR